jgi:hypothetical protein
MKFVDMYQWFGEAYYTRVKDSYPEDGDSWVLYHKQCMSTKLHSVTFQQKASQQSPL